MNGATARRGGLLQRLLWPNTRSISHSNLKSDLLRICITIPRHLKKIVQTGITILSFLSFMTVHAQQKISGKVIDKITREPLEMAVVSDPTTKQNTLTDKDGKFVLKSLTFIDSVVI